MKLGWMRIEGPTAPHLTWSELQNAIAQSEELNLRQIHTPQLQMEQVRDLPETQSLRIGLCAKELRTKPPRLVMSKLKEIMDALEARLVLTFPMSASSEARTAGQVLETLILERTDQDGLPGSPAAHNSGSGFPMDPPHPEVLSIPRVGCLARMRNAAGNGFHALSPAWQSHRDLAHHWRDIVIGATHAARRAKPSEWHVARYIYVSEAADEAIAYRNRIAENHEVHGFSCRGDALREVIAGSTEEVTQKLRDLRKTAGPFGVLQCVDPGLDASEGQQQRERLIKNVLPSLSEEATTNATELENT